MMAKDDFYSYLKRQGRKEDVAKRVIKLVEVFIGFQHDRGQTLSQQTSKADLDTFIELVEGSQAKFLGPVDISGSANRYLWAIRYYYDFIENQEMAAYALMLRKARTKHRPFKIKDFKGVSSRTIAALRQAGINNINQMLKAGRTKGLRRKLAAESGVPERELIDLVRLSDLARIPGVKGIRARLYLDAGINSVEMMAKMQAEEILAVTSQFVEETGFDGIPPLPAEVRFSIAKAKDLPKVVEYE